MQALELEYYEVLISALCTCVTWGESYVKSLGGENDQGKGQHPSNHNHHNNKLFGIGLSQPCATDSTTGLALSGGALGYIAGRNIRLDLAAATGYPKEAISAENDGNCAALAEVWVGAASSVANMALVVCGSGIGGALISDGRIVPGAHQYAGEFGFTIVDFKERPISWSEAGSSYALAISAGKENALEVFALAETGDAQAQAAIRRFYNYFALGLHNLQHTFDPELILIGGGISANPALIPGIEAAMDQLYNYFDHSVLRPKIATCALGPEANLVGAIYHHRNSCNRRPSN